MAASCFFDLWSERGRATEAYRLVPWAHLRCWSIRLQPFEMETVRGAFTRPLDPSRWKPLTKGGLIKLMSSGRFLAEQSQCLSFKMHIHHSRLHWHESQGGCSMTVQARWSITLSLSKYNEHVCWSGLTMQKRFSKPVSLKATESSPVQLFIGNWATFVLFKQLWSLPGTAQVVNNTEVNAFAGVLTFRITL